MLLTSNQTSFIVLEKAVALQVNTAKMCLVGVRRHPSVASLTAASHVLADEHAAVNQSDEQSHGAKVLIQPMTTDQSSSKTATKCPDEQNGASSRPNYTRQNTNSPEPSCKKRNLSFVDGVDDKINNTNRSSSSAFVLGIPGDADMVLRAKHIADLAPPRKRARLLSFRKSSTTTTYESVKSSLLSCDMTIPQLI